MKTRLDIFYPSIEASRGQPQQAFTSFPVAADMTVTISWQQGLRIAFRLLRDSLVAAVRQDTVSFTAYHEERPK